MKHVASDWIRTMAIAAVLMTAVQIAAAEEAATELDAILRRVQHALAQGDYSEAAAELDRAVQLAPKDAKCRGLRGAARLRLGDYVRGAADLRAAVELNPGDAALGDPPRKNRLSNESLEHGRQQVERMMRDRPAMRQYGDGANFLREFAIRKFAGEDFGSPIDWDPSAPLHSDAEHLAPTKTQHAAVLVAAAYDSGPSVGKPRSFEELWAGAIFELYNVNYAQEFVRLHQKADEGKITKEAFIAGILKYELTAAQRTRAFYLRTFLPWAAKNKLATDPMLWFCGWWASPENALQQFTDKSTYPWRPYAQMYDWAAFHRLWHEKKYERAEQILVTMRTETPTLENDDVSEIFYWIGRCRVQLNRSASALVAFNIAIQNDAANAAAYRARGELYEKLGEQSKAAADFAEAKQLEAEQKSE